MIRAHCYLVSKSQCKRLPDKTLQHAPRKGDTVRLSDTLFAKVTEVFWCFDEHDHFGQRVNITLKNLPKRRT